VDYQGIALEHPWRLLHRRNESWKLPVMLLGSPPRSAMGAGKEKEKELMDFGMASHSGNQGLVLYETLSHPHLSMARPVKKNANGC